MRDDDIVGYASTQAAEIKVVPASYLVFLFHLVNCDGVRSQAGVTE